MSATSKSDLKGYFNTGDKPTEAQFENLIDSFAQIAAVPVGTAGTVLVDDTAAVSWAPSDLGKTFLCPLDGAAKTVTLPTVTAIHVGGTITLIQSVSLVGSGVLTLSCGTSGTFSTNSYYTGYASSLYVAPTRPSAANNTIVITGAATNSAWGIGSTIKFTVVAADEWIFEAKAQPIGTGNTAVAYSTV